MQAATVNASGAFVFWTCATWSNQAKLAEGMQAIGMGGFAPKPMAREVALREALEVVMDGKGRMVRPLAEANGFCVIEEEKGTDANNYVQVLMAKIDGPRITLKPFDQDQANKIADAFKAHLGYVPGHQVGHALVSIVKRFSGIAIRQTGGLYWLPIKHAEAWRKIADAVEMASAIGQSKVYLATMAVNADSIRVVRDAIKREILAESERILTDLKGDLGQKAIDGRLRYVKDLEAKVTEYEGIVGESLGDLREALGKCSHAVGLGAFRSLMGEEENAA